MKFEICVTRENEPDFISQQIMRKMDCDYSHILILVDNHHIFHATGEGFNKTDLIKFSDTHVIVKRHEVAPINAAYAFGWLHGMLGKEYSQSQYLGFFWPKLMRFVSNKNEKTICSEAAAEFLVSCCGKLGLYDLDFVTPRQIFEFVENPKDYTGGWVSPK